MTTKVNVPNEEKIIGSRGIFKYLWIFIEQNFVIDGHYWMLGVHAFSI